MVNRPPWLNRFFLYSPPMAIPSRPSFKILIFSFLVLMAGGRTAFGNGGVALEQAILSSDLPKAMKAYAETPLSVSIPVLTSMAQSNVVMAQWFLADALAQTHQDPEATLWLYTASLGTRMDASICRIRGSKGLEYIFVQTFSKEFDRLRENEKLRREALSRAVAFHQRRAIQSAIPNWTCTITSSWLKRPPSNNMLPQADWQSARQKEIRSYQKQTGLDFSKSPDLFIMTTEPPAF